MIVANIVFISHGITSPLNAALEFSRRLTAAGHEVTFMSHAEVGEEVRAHGFCLVQLTPDDEIRQRPTHAKSPWRWVREMRKARKRSIANTEIEDKVSALDPDLLVIDVEMHFAVIATANLNIPTMLALNFFSVFRLPGLPPLNSSLSPADDWTWERFRAAWMRVRLSAWWARVRHKVGKGGVGDLLRPVALGTYHYADLKQVAKHRNYPLRQNVDRNEWLRPYMYTRLPVLCFNAFELEFPHQPHPNIHYVGPMVNKHRPERRVDDESRRRWEAFKQARATSALDRPLVYCSLGSYWADRDFLRMVVATFRRRPEWDLVLGLGGQTSEADLGPIPENVLVLDWAPQLEVLQLADCAISHGGITSINECISSGVPVVVYSPSLLDQDGNAARIAYHRLGVAAEWDTDRPEALERHIDDLLADASIGANVAAMARLYDRYERRAAAVVATYLSVPKARRPSG